MDRETQGKSREGLEIHCFFFFICLYFVCFGLERLERCCLAGSPVKKKSQQVASRSL